ncbi:MAG: hypothetical protein HYZ00_09820 [Candidatus Hydrogenedentes bacterium]|nr:hypothetical protein [Candidatus Hydrogenedentota bacterium]
MTKLETDEAVIRSAINKADLPESVLEVKTEFDADATGDPAVWLYVIVSDKEANSRKFSQSSLDILEKLREAVQQTGVDRWPYIRFRSESEQATLSEEDSG